MTVAINSDPTRPSYNSWLQFFVTKSSRRARTFPSITTGQISACRKASMRSDRLYLALRYLGELLAASLESAPPRSRTSKSF